jgi:hypothetical protein
VSGDSDQLPYTADDRRKHLDYIQAVIARLAHGSNSAKGFALSIAAAAFGFSALNEAWYLSLLGIAVVASFSVLDMHYLYQERLFRCLFCAVVDGRVADYDMNKDRYKHQVTRTNTYLSWSVLGFYLPLLATGLAVVAIALATDAGAVTVQGPADAPSASPAATRR